MQTRIAGVHFSDARPAAGEKTKLIGYLQKYDEEAKTWIPAEHKKLKLLVNDEEVAETVTDANGRFEFELQFDKSGEYEVEVVFEGTQLLEGCSVAKKVVVMSENSKKKILRLAKIAFLIILAGIAALLVVAFVLSRG